MTSADDLAATAGELARSGDATAAEASARAALAIEPGHAIAHRYLAVALLQQGHHATARAAASRAVALAPDDAVAHEILGAVLVGSGAFAAARAIFTRAALLAPGRGEPCFNVGVIAEAQDDLDGAIAAYREATARSPQFRPALTGLARTLGQLDRRAEAIAAWRGVLAIDPGDPSALHLIAALSGTSCAAPPAGFVQRTFDAYAQRFDQHLVEHLGYQGPAVLRDVLGERRFARALDLGCGTGLIGAALRDRCDHLAGVDLSPRMLDQAARTGAYDALAVGDVVDHLRASDDPLDLVIAADVLGYLGDLAPLFAAVRPRLGPGGWFAFTVERGDSGHQLQSSGRWAHAAAYVEQLARDADLAVHSFRETALRVDLGGAVTALVYVLTATTAAESRA